MSKECTTHHFACDCREEKFKELEQENAALQEALACLLDWGLQPPDYWRDQTKGRFIADIQKASNLLKRKEEQP